MIKTVFSKDLNSLYTKNGCGKNDNLVWKAGDLMDVVWLNGPQKS